MRNGNASVTHNVTRESRPPVPSHPYPARPALYRYLGETSHHGVGLGDAVAAPDAMMSRTISRFAASFEVTADGCWNWTANVNHKGYGRIWNGHRYVVAHRFSYELIRGPVPAHLDAGHLCHNRACVNPDHIKPMTRSDNLLMRPQSGRRDRAMTSTERNRRRRERLREIREQERLESGWWVEI